MHFKLKTNIPLAKLAGFIDHYYDSNKLLLTESGKVARDILMNKLRDETSEIDYLKSMEEGKSLKLEQAIELVLHKE
jgi:hypothetical protein